MLPLTADLRQLERHHATQLALSAGDRTMGGGMGGGMHSVMGGSMGGGMGGLERGAGFTHHIHGRNIGSTTTPLPKYTFGAAERGAPEPPVTAGMGGYRQRGYSNGHVASSTPQSVVSSAAPPPSAGSTVASDMGYADRGYADRGISFGATSFSTTQPARGGASADVAQARGGEGGGADLDAYIAQLDQRLHKSFGTPHSTRLGYMKRGRD
jgi:hypothetical protein